MAQRKNQTPNKGAEVIDKFIRESGEDLTSDLKNNVNWATGDEVKGLKKPTSKDFFDATSSRQTDAISSEVITIDENQDALNLIFRNSLNIRDMGNPLYGEEDGSFKKNLKINIQKADPSHNKVCIIYGGDLLGSEWELKRLNNAKILVQTKNGETAETPYEMMDENGNKQKDGEEIKKALFFALGERVKVLKRDIRFALSHNVDVYLMNGAQEEKINKYFKVDVLATILRDIDDPRLHYIKGVNTVINVEKKVKGEESKFATIGFLTNNGLSKAQNGQSSVNAVKFNSGKSLGNIVFVTNTNTAGKKENFTYFVSGESTYKETSPKKNPELSPRDYNCFSLRIPEKNLFTVIEGNNEPEFNLIEMEVYKEQKILEEMKSIVLDTVTAKLNDVTLGKNGEDVVRYFQIKKAREDKALERKTTNKKNPVVETIRSRRAKQNEINDTKIQSNPDADTMGD